MKKSIQKRLLLLISIWATAVTSFAQPMYRLIVTNEAMPSRTEYEFDIFILAVDSVFPLSNVGVGLGFDVSILNGGTPVPSIVGGSEMNASQVPSRILIGEKPYEVDGVTYRYFNIAQRVNPGAANATMISNEDKGCTHPGTKLGRFKITNSVPFAEKSTAKLLFSTAPGSGRTNTIVSWYNGVVPTAITNPANHIGYNGKGSCVVQPHGLILKK